MQIVEITRRAKRGRTEPFICRGRDNKLYFVKGRHAGFHSMICEWVAGRLAQELNLPIAPFEVVEIPEILVQSSLVTGAIELGRGEAFGSREIEFASDFQWSQVANVDPWLRAKILVFDWWIANNDRVLGAEDGNVNLLWTNSPEKLHLIDHNLAFSHSVDDFTWTNFCSNHVFGQCWNDTLAREQHLSGPIGALEVAAAAGSADEGHRDFGARCEALLDKIDEIWDELPETWQDSCQTLEVEEVKQILGRGNGPLW